MGTKVATMAVVSLVVTHTGVASFNRSVKHAAEACYRQQTVMAKYSNLCIDAARSDNYSFTVDKVS